MLSKKFTKVKKILFRSSSPPLVVSSKFVMIYYILTLYLKDYLWNVPISDNDVISLFDTLSNNKTLKTLDLSNCDITDKGVQHIYKAIVENKTLAMLAVSNSLGITSFSTSAIVELIKTTTSLEILYISSQYFTER